MNHEFDPATVLLIGELILSVVLILCFILGML